MGRLIDEDILIKRIYEYQTNAIDTEDVIHSIKTMPTAYDVESVVAELEKLKENDFGCSGMRCSKCNYQSKCFNVDKAFKVALDNAISIVRGKE